MGIGEFLGVVGAATYGALAALFFIVWRSLRVRWAWLLACGFLAMVGGFCNMALGRYVPGGMLSETPVFLNALFYALALVFTTAGLLDRLEIKPPSVRWFNLISITVAVVTMAAIWTSDLKRGGALIVVGLYMLFWAGASIWARVVQGRKGYGPAVAACAVYALMMVAAALGAVPPNLDRYISLAPLLILGTSLLTTGLLSAHRQAAEELRARERVEAELRLTNESLEQRVAQRTQDLRETIDALESFNRNVSHDLRGPLGGIAGVAKLVREHIANGNAEAADKMAAAIEAQAENSGRLVSALLAMARASDVVLNTQSVHTDALVHEIVDTLHQARPSEDLPVSMQHLPDVQADPALLRQVFANLIGNALKFAAAAVSPKVEVGAIGDEQRPVFFVRDNGVGFNAEESGDLFKPFRRLNHGQRFEGFGVGLSIVKRIIDRHGGRVWAEGRPGQGATFFFTLGRTPAA